MDSTLETQNHATGAVQEAFVRSVKQAESNSFAPSDDDGFSFLDVLDIINPLQHIPVISTLYRDATGDELGAAARVAGGALWGGPIGAISSAVNVVVEEVSGKDIGEHALSWFQGSEGPQLAEWPEGGLNPAPVESEELPPPLAGTRPAEGLAAAAEDPVTAWARSTVQGAQVAATDPVSAWAAQEARIRTASAQPVPTAADPVASWAANEVNIRSAEAQGPARAQDAVSAWARDEARLRTAEAHGGPADPVSAWARRETTQLADLAATGSLGTQAPADANVLAILQGARQESDASMAAHRQSLETAEHGRSDRALEGVVGEALRDSTLYPATSAYRQVAALGSDGRVTAAFSAKG